MFTEATFEVCQNHLKLKKIIHLLEFFCVFNWNIKDKVSELSGLYFNINIDLV